MKPSRFEPTITQRVQQGMLAKSALKLKPCHVPPVSLTGFTGSVYDYSMLEGMLNDRMMADLKYGTFTTASKAATELTYASIKETMEQIAKFDAPKRKMSDYVTMDFVIPPIAARPNAMPVSSPYYDPPMAAAQIEEERKPPERECIPRSTGYGEWKFDHVALKRRAEALVACLPRIMAELNADHIVVRGTSGTMMAPVLLYLMPDLKVVMLRKQSELRDSHGAKIEGTMGQFYRRGLIIDDMVESGRTVRGMIEDHECDIVGVLCHNGAELHGVNATRHALNTRGIPHYTFH